MDETKSNSSSKSITINVRNTRFCLSRPRPLGEFIFDHKRWKIPNFRQTSALWQQVKINLLYFQTNYLMISFALLVMLMIVSMRTLLTGVISAVILILSALFFFEHIPQARQIKQNYPTFVIICGVVLIIVAWQALHTILLICVIAVAPVPLWLLHAAFRSSEGLIVRDGSGTDYFINTPMGQIMQMLGIDPKVSA